MNKEIAASAILFTCVFIAIWYVLPATSQESGNVAVHFVDVGQGARATLLEVIIHQRNQKGKNLKDNQPTL